MDAVESESPPWLAAISSVSVIVAQRGVKADRPRFLGDPAPAQRRQRRHCTAGVDAGRVAMGDGGGPLPQRERGRRRPVAEPARRPGAHHRAAAVGAIDRRVADPATGVPPWDRSFPA
jgi:hypothetical protein